MLKATHTEARAVDAGGFQRPEARPPDPDPRPARPPARHHGAADRRSSSRRCRASPARNATACCKPIAHDFKCAEPLQSERLGSRCGGCWSRASLRTIGPDRTAGASTIRQALDRHARSAGPAAAMACKASSARVIAGRQHFDAAIGQVAARGRAGPARTRLRRGSRRGTTRPARLPLTMKRAALMLAAVSAALRAAGLGDGRLDVLRRDRAEELAWPPCRRAR